MKLLTICICLAGLYLVYQLSTSGKEKKQSTHDTSDSVRVQKRPLFIMFYQDVTGSDTENGVVFAVPNDFEPMNACTTRSITLYFSIIKERSTDRPIQLVLPKADFEQPRKPDFESLQFLDRAKAKKQYVHDLEKYQIDSSVYFADRARRIAKFKKDMEVMLLPYKNRWAKRTDITSAVAIADKVFNAARYDDGECILIMNSDAMDSYRHHIDKPHNEFKTILVNASTKDSSSVQDLFPETVTSISQAIEYSLK